MHRPGTNGNKNRHLLTPVGSQGKPIVGLASRSKTHTVTDVFLHIVTVITCRISSMKYGIRQSKPEKKIQYKAKQIRKKNPHGQKAKQRAMLTPVGFEPTLCYELEPKSSALDHSAKVSQLMAAGNNRTYIKVIQTKDFDPKTCMKTVIIMISSATGNVGGTFTRHTALKLPQWASSFVNLKCTAGLT